MRECHEENSYLKKVNRKKKIKPEEVDPGEGKIDKNIPVLQSQCRWSEVGKEVGKMRKDKKAEEKKIEEERKKKLNGK